MADGCAWGGLQRDAAPSVAEGEEEDNKSASEDGTGSHSDTDADADAGTSGSDDADASADARSPPLAQGREVPASALTPTLAVTTAAAVLAGVVRPPLPSANDADDEDSPSVSRAGGDTRPASDVEAAAESLFPDVVARPAVLQTLGQRPGSVPPSSGADEDEDDEHGDAAANRSVVRLSV
jgi:hypothetical protein